MGVRCRREATARPGEGPKAADTLPRGAAAAWPAEGRQQCRRQRLTRREQATERAGIPQNEKGTPHPWQGESSGRASSDRFDCKGALLGRYVYPQSEQNLVYLLLVIYMAVRARLGLSIDSPGLNPLKWVPIGN